MDIANRLKTKLESFFPNTPVHLCEPSLKGNESNYLQKCIDTNFVSSVGAFVDRFEKDLSSFSGLQRSVVCVNGTAALQICGKLTGVESDDEVLMPTLSFVATANAVKYLNAHPHFVDSSKDDLGIDVDKLRKHLTEIAQYKEGRTYNKRTGRRISALVTMHTFGHISPQIDDLKTLCDEFHIVLIEDAAEAMGSYYNGKHAGSWGLLSALSFNGNKIMTTGGGGAIITNDTKLGDRAKHLTTTAKQPHPWRYFHDEVGHNYRMPNLNAALGCAQIEQMPSFLNAKRVIHEKYLALFENDSDFAIFQDPSGCHSNYWLVTLILNKPNRSHLEDCLNLLNEVKIGVRPVWEPLDTLPMYQTCEKMDLQGAHELSMQIISLPSSVGLEDVLA